MAMTQSQLEALVLEYKARADKAEAALAARPIGKLTFKVSEKSGALSVIGMGKWPTTLYRAQWERLLAEKDNILAFIKANEARLASKGD